MNNETLNFHDDEFIPSHFEPLPKRLNGHRLCYIGKPPKVKETKEQTALTDVAVGKWKRYKEVYAPLQDEYIKQVGAQNTAGAYSAARGAAGSATSAAFEEPRRQMEAALESRGVNPNSGRFSASTSRLADARAKSSADTQGKAQTDQQSDHIMGLSNVVAIGQGKSAEAQQGFSSLAKNAQNKAMNDATNSFNNKAEMTSTLGSLAGAGAYEYSHRDKMETEK